jgi:hypothetical protein
MPKTAPAPTTINPHDYCAVTKTRGAMRDGRPKTYPDFVNSAALKALPRELAEELGWSAYADFVPCRAGHVAPKFTANQQCVECWRVSKGKAPVHGRAKDKQYYAERKPKPATAGAPKVIAAPTAPQLDAKDQKFLTALAGLRDFEKAAAAVGSTRALIESRISCNKSFADVVKDHCDRLMIPRPPAAPKKFEWDDEKRELLVTTYIDTGELESARAAVGCSPSQFYREVDSNSQFRASLDEAAPRAARVLEDVGIKLSKAGNDKLLTATLKAKLPNEYGDRLKLDITTRTDKLSDTELDARFHLMLKTLLAGSGYKFITPKGEIIDAEFTDATPRLADTTGKDRTAEVADGEAGASEADGANRSTDNDDLL